MGKWLTFTILAALLTIGAGTSEVKPRELHISEVKALDVPIFPAYGYTLADEDGDFFFHLGGSPFTNATIMKLSHSSWDPTLFRLPSELKIVIVSTSSR